MANTNIADVLSWIATQVAATTPPVATDPVDTAFVEAGDGMPEFEPNGYTVGKNHDRLFEVRAPAVREVNVGGNYSDRTVEQMIEVEVGYVRSLKRTDFHARIGRDREVIENRLALRTGDPTGVKVVNPVGAVVRAKHAHPDWVTQVITISVQYQLATT